MQSVNRSISAQTDHIASNAGLPDREAIADKLAALDDAAMEFLRTFLGNSKQDETLFGGIELYLHRAAAGRFLHTLKLEKTGEWLGNAAPARLQIRLMEIAKSSHHPAFQSFRSGVVRSGGLQRAYPAAR
jgi:hypothetical protein